MCRAKNEINSIVFQIICPGECTCTARTAMVSFPEVREPHLFISLKNWTRLGQSFVCNIICDVDLCVYFH